VSRLLLGALVAQLTVIGYTSLKEATIPAILSVPLPFITGFYFFYIRRRFAHLETCVTQEEISELEGNNVSRESKSYLQKSFVAEPLNLSALQSSENSIKQEV
jgi:hypothetical protein